MSRTNSRGVFLPWILFWTCIFTHCSPSVSSTSLASFNYATAGLSGTGKRQAVDELIYASTTIDRVIRYLYDHRYRLIEEKHGINSDDPTIGYVYDKVGNRLSRASTVPSVPSVLSSTYDPNDRLEPVSNFDENGNTLLGEVTPAQTANDEYDYENRLIKRTVSGRTIELRYDADGNRVRKIVTENDVVKTTAYLIDELNPTDYAQVLREETTRSDGTFPFGWDRRYVYGLDLISTHIDTDSHYYGYDGHGSVRFLTDSAGTITDTYTYDAFGILLSSTGVTPNHYLFAGEYFDSHLGQYYNRARIFNQNIGRFATTDPHPGSPNDPLSLHKYLYCHADPVNNIDPSGQSIISDVLYSIAARVWIFAQTYGPAIYRARLALATFTLAAFVAEPEFRAMYVSSIGGPGSAVTLLAADIRFVSAAGSGLVRYGTVQPNVVTIRLNRGDPSDFRSKAESLKRVANEGGLTVVSSPTRIRDASAQAAYRNAVFIRYVRYLQQLGMTEEQATAQATQKFKTLHADHRIDLQVSGSLNDPNSASNLQMLDGSVNTSVGRQLANEIERLGLQTGDQIHDVNIVAP